MLNVNAAACDKRACITFSVIGNLTHCTFSDDDIAAGFNDCRFNKAVNRDVFGCFDFHFLCNITIHQNSTVIGDMSAAHIDTIADKGVVNIHAEFMVFRHPGNRRHQHVLIFITDGGTGTHFKFQPFTGLGVKYRVFNVIAFTALSRCCSAHYRCAGFHTNDVAKIPEIRFFAVTGLRLEDPLKCIRDQRYKS